MIEPSEFAQAAIGRRFEVVDFPDGRMGGRYKGRSMPYRTFDRRRRVTEMAVLENKRLGGLLALIRQDQQNRAGVGRFDNERFEGCHAASSARPARLPRSICKTAEKSLRP